ncbi:MAG: hypothetical protein ACRCXZ_03450 [Patescibacteria group bacterium]
MKRVKTALISSFLGVSGALISAFPSFGLVNNSSFKYADLFVVSGNNVNVRSTACGNTVVGGANKNVVAFYMGQKKLVSGTCKGFTNATWYKVGMSAVIPDGGTEYVEGWVVGNYLDHVPLLTRAISEPFVVRVNVTSGTLNLRNGSLTGPVVKSIPNNTKVKVLEVLPQVTVGGVKHNPVKVRVYLDGAWRYGVVSSNYLVAFEILD